MAPKTKKRKSQKNQSRYIGKPGGIIQDRVRQAGPENFGILAVDCAKLRSKWMLCDFFGKVVIEPTKVEHSKGCLRAMVALATEACEQSGFTDRIVAVEMTGVYHKPVQQAFRKAGFDTRLVHPFASKHYRQPAHRDLKTDDTDLEAIFRAAAAGYGLASLPVDSIYTSLQLLARHRRNLVQQRARIQVQMRVPIHRAMPGYADLFDNEKFWNKSIALPLARRFGSAAEFRDAGIDGMGAHFKAEKIRFQSRTLERVLAWANSAAEPDAMAPLLTRIWRDLDDNRKALGRQIVDIEQQIAGLLTQTPYVLLLSITGINVVTAGELAGEAGPIEHYASGRAITGRAGLFPSRYQSDQVDRAAGPLAKTGNRKLRAACLRIAENLIKCHPYYRGLSAQWALKKVDPRDRRCRVANRAMRMIFQIVAGRQVYRRKGFNREYLMAKLVEFHRLHKTSAEQLVADLNHTVKWLPKSTYAAEGKPLSEWVRRRRGGPQPIGDMLLPLLIRLGVKPAETLDSESSEARGSH